MRMFMFGTVIAVAVVGFAQELVPELAAASGKHTAAVEALEKLRLESVAQAARSYVTALDGVEKSATAKGEIDLVAAVVKEREAAVAGTLEPDLPAALPKVKLQSARKALRAKIESVNADFARRHKLADADYLKALASLQAKASANPELAKQVAAEKAVLLSGAVSNGEIGKVPRGKNVAVNGDFEKIGADGRPEGWDWSECVTVAIENGNTFVRIETVPMNNDGSTNYRAIRQEIVLPKGAKKVFVSGKIRAKNCSYSTKPERAVGVGVCYFDQNGKGYLTNLAKWKGKNGQWEVFQSEEIPREEAVKAVVVIKNGSCPGQIDFDDIEVTFK